MIALDLSRLLSRADSAAPTGIDRVELAYARHFGTASERFVPVARNALGGCGRLPARPAAAFVDGLAAAWRDGAPLAARRELAALARRLRRAALFGEARLRTVLRSADETPVYLLVSHQKLERGAALARLKAQGARVVCLVHDLIPLDFPCLTRPDQERRHARRIANLAVLADAAIVNSASTGDALNRRLGDGTNLPVTVAPLGTDLPDAPTPPPDAPYFVCVGTIEARKNHALLLEVWSRLAAELGGRAPRLLLIGRRGFGAERIAERLARLPHLVVEHPVLPDRRMAALLRGARALLMPSFAEGFGLPVVEALARGVPVLCSDLPALRESGGGVPDHLDPADVDAWHAAVLAYLTDSERRRAQLARLRDWRAPSWERHFAVVEQVVAGLR